MSLEKLIESHFAPKKGNDLLIQLIESKLNEQEQPSFDIPKVFAISPLDSEAGVGEIEGKHKKSAAYAEYEELLKNIKGNAPFLYQRLERVNDFFDNPQKIIKSGNIQRVFSSFLFIQEMRENLIHTDDSVAGFQAETIMAQLIDGSKEANNGAVDIDSQKVFKGGVQLKTLSARDPKNPRSKDPKVGGSFINLMDYYKTQPDYFYIIILKDPTDGIYRFFTFKLDFAKFLEVFEIKNFRESFQVHIPPDNFRGDANLYKRFTTSLGQYFNTTNNVINIPELKSITNITPDYMLERHKMLKFIEKNMETITPNKEFSISTQYELNKEFMASVYSDRSKPSIETFFAGELDLRDEKLNAAIKSYGKTLTGKMFEVLNLLKYSISSMNSYFATKNQSTGYKTVDKLSETTNKFNDYFLK